MKIKDWITAIASILASATIVGAVGIAAGDTRWVTAETFDKRIDKIEINALDRQITFLQIKINQGEATTSERIYIEALKQQLRALDGSE